MTTQALYKARLEVTFHVFLTPVCVSGSGTQTKSDSQNIALLVTMVLDLEKKMEQMEESRDKDKKKIRDLEEEISRMRENHVDHLSNQKRKIMELQSKNLTAKEWKAEMNNLIADLPGQDEVILENEDQVEGAERVSGGRRLKSDWPKFLLCILPCCKSNVQ
ncbi:uncharacterized protein LOC144427368 isoform X2 [Styela clava]